MSLSSHHKCPVAGCEIHVSNRLLMCASHWHLVPKALQGSVYRAWRSGNKRAHAAACKAAIESVNTARESVNTVVPSPEP
jgi:hypothetical protein